MGCNCKKNVNNKYLTDEEKLANQVKKLNGLEKIAKVVFQFIYGVIAIPIIIIAVSALLMYVIFSLLTGIQVTLRIPNFIKWFRK